MSQIEEIFSHQVGLEKQKKQLLRSLRAEEFCRSNKIQRETQTMCLAGPPGTGKTTFAQTIACLLNKKMITVPLGELTDASVLLGTSENSSGSEIGQLTKSLIESGAPNPLILLKEIDKVSSSRSSIYSCLATILDPIQNHKILDHYLDVELDFSQATFVITANDLKKIPEYLLSQMMVIDFPGYSIEQKEEIANRFTK